MACAKEEKIWPSIHVCLSKMFDAAAFHQDGFWNCDKEGFLSSATYFA